MATAEKLRIDKYLWAIRIFKTRSLASLACEQGKVKHKGVAIKAAKQVTLGEEYEVRTEARKWVIRVTGLLANRVQYQEAIKFYVDITPEDDMEKMNFQAAAFFTGKRRSKIGRPTKKQRRDLEGFTESDEIPPSTDE